MTVAATVNGSRPAIGSWLRDEIGQERGFYAGLAAFVLATIALAAFRGETVLPHMAEYGERIGRVVVALLSGLILVLCLRALLRGGEGLLLKSIFVSFKLIVRAKYLRFLYACVLLALFMAAFLYHKAYIPVLVPFRWDATFAQWEAALLGGRQPWEVIHPLVGYPPITILLDIVYASWVVMVFVVWSGLLISSRTPRALRMRYWRATFLSWIVIGLVMATGLSSAGPCFFGNVVPGVPDQFAGLTLYLAQVDALFPLSQMESREFLWDVYMGRSDLPGGISAMPSMHNAQAALFVAAGFALNRKLGVAMLIYGILIFIGSIHLGWHYALDGIVGVAAAAVIWWICGWQLLGASTDGRTGLQATPSPSEKS